jgi:hypothetical protein
MRFCPYCSAENVDLALECQSCKRRLMPLPAPRAGSDGAAAPMAPAGGSSGSGAVAAPGLQTRSGLTLPPPNRTRRTAPLPSMSTTPIHALAERDELSRPEATPLTELQPEPEPETETTGLGFTMPEPTLAPPPTRQVGPDGDSPALLPVVDPLPEPPDGGWLAAARYTLSFARGVWQRRVAVKDLNEQIRLDTVQLDGLLGALGRTVRQLRLNNRALAAENLAIDEAEKRRSQAEIDSDELIRRLEEENQRFAEQELDRENKLAEAETALAAADKELESYEAQRRSLRDKRKTIERQQRAYVKTAEDRETEAAKATDDDGRAQLRRSAEDLRCEAAALDPERQDLDRRLGALEKPVSQSAARVEALRGEQESIRRALHDLREGHRHRLSEIEAEQGRRGRDVTTAEAEIGRRLVTLGTLLNLNRVERPEFDELYARIDQLRAAIGARTQEIDRLTAERGSYDRGVLLRGIAVLALGLVVLTTAVVLIVALL